MSKDVENVHRSKILDALIGEQVTIKFKTDDCLWSGTLLWADHSMPMFKSDMYALSWPGGGISFYKSHVQSIAYGLKGLKRLR